MITPQQVFLQNREIGKIIQIDQLLCVQVEDYLLTCNLESGERFSCCKSLSEMEELLPDGFFRVNRCCLINKNKISSINRKKRMIELVDGSTHIISIRRMKEVWRALTG